MRINIINKSHHTLPKYATRYSAGMDLRANIDEEIILQPMERVLIRTGLFLEIPIGYEAQIRPRSGLAINDGITILNSPGTIDADYRGEVCIILINLSNTIFVIHDGDRIGQMIVSKYEKVDWRDVDELSDTERGIDGFGHTKKD